MDKVVPRYDYLVLRSVGGAGVLIQSQTKNWVNYKYVIDNSFPFFRLCHCFQYLDLWTYGNCSHTYFNMSVFKFHNLKNQVLLLSRQRAAVVFFPWGNHPQALCDLGSVPQALFLPGKNTFLDFLTCTSAKMSEVHFVLPITYL